jgi:hypothetical protein
MPLLAVAGAALLGGGAAASEEARAPESTQAPWSIFLLVRATPHWLALAPEERFAFIDEEIRGRLEAHPEVGVRFWDVEHMNARVSDLILFETRDLSRYRSLVEGIRETRFWGHYFEVLEILPGIENGYAEHYGVEAYGGGTE